MWKARTRTKIMTIALLLIAVWVSVVIYGWYNGKLNAPEMVIALLSTGGLSFMTFLWSIMKENNGGGGPK